MDLLMLEPRDYLMETRENFIVVRVLFFALASEQAGARQVDLELPLGATIATLRQILIDRFPTLTALLQRSALALNEEFADDAQTIPSHAEIACIPPVSGGAN